jgi:hypothetical protein
MGKPLKSTDRRRLRRKFVATTDTDGAGPPLADLFNDRRKHANGSGKKAK